MNTNPAATMIGDLLRESEAVRARLESLDPDSEKDALLKVRDEFRTRTLRCLELAFGPDNSYSDEVRKSTYARFDWIVYLDACCGALRLARDELAAVEQAEAGQARPAKQGKARVFIIHGHDREAALDLQKLLNRSCDSVEAVMFEDLADTSKTIIENLEETIGSSDFAFALFTPDDFVQKGGITYSQMRPNVVLELGWFYGKLGRKGAAVVQKQGTKMPSDLDGLLRIEYPDQVKQAFADIQTTLRKAGLIT